TRKAKRRKRMQERIEGWSSTHPLRDRGIGGSQPVVTPSRLAGSQSSQLVASSQGTGGHDSIPMIMSQAAGDRYGDRKGKAKGEKQKKSKPKVLRPAGFK
ncbi:MAG: hypothetical protein Q9164_007856, partial [Protoblastenia rupestris]